jgi:hypothetical protein
MVLSKLANSPRYIHGGVDGARKIRADINPDKDTSIEIWGA